MEKSYRFSGHSMVVGSPISFYTPCEVSRVLSRETEIQSPLPRRFELSQQFDIHPTAGNFFSQNKNLRHLCDRVQISHNLLEFIAICKTLKVVLVPALSRQHREIIEEEREPIDEGRRI